MSGEAEGKSNGVVGFVEHLHPKNGLIGWAVDRSDPGRRLNLELLLGETRVIAETQTGQPRKDVEDSLGFACSPGFAFGRDVIGFLAAMPRRLHDQRLTVRVTDDDVAIPASDRFRTLDWPEIVTGAVHAGQTGSEGTVVEANAAGANGYIEEFYIVPRFGCIVSGWVVSSVKPISSLAVRVGTLVAECEERSMRHIARRDVQSHYPKSTMLVAQAGFTAVFRNREVGGPATPCALVLRFADGTAANIPVPQASILTVGYSVPLEALLKPYPTITDEAFFEDMARAIRENQKVAPPTVRPYEIEPVEAACVVALPPGRSDMVKAFSDLHQHVAEMPDHAGVVLLARDSHDRSEVVSRFRALKADFPRASLWMIGSEPAISLLPKVLGLVGAEVFVLVGPGLFLSPAGWAATVKILTEQRDDLTLMEICDPVGDEVPRLSSSCIGWTRTALQRWMRDKPFMFGGEYRIDDLPSGSAYIVPEAALFSMQIELSKFVAAIDAVP